jgi:bile acid:Na+ symporter, BASS family
MLYLCDGKILRVKQILNIIKDWMLPIAIATGILSYLILHFIPVLRENVEPWFSVFAKDVQPVFMATMLFLQFNRISPHDLKFKPWHFWMLAFQMVSFGTMALLAVGLPDGEMKILAESAMLCFVCPTAAAAGVITSKLGGKLSDTVTYVVLINIAVTIAIPLVVPLVKGSSDMSFFQGVLAISKRIFPLLVMPLLLAWVIRYCFRKLQRKLMRYTDWAFYCWGMALCLSIYLATRAMILSGTSAWTGVGIGVISLIACFIQLAVGHAIGKRYGSSEAITAQQALGQKNSGFLIWVGYSFLTPVTSVAGGLYSIWQNLVNSLELYQAKKSQNI